MLQNNVIGFMFLTEIHDNHTRATSDLPNFSFGINLTQTSPFTQGLCTRKSEEANNVLCTNGLNRFNIFRVVTVFC